MPSRYRFCCLTSPSMSTAIWSGNGNEYVHSSKKTSCCAIQGDDYHSPVPSTVSNVPAPSDRRCPEELIQSSILTPRRSRLLDKLECCIIKPNRFEVSAHFKGKRHCVYNCRNAAITPNKERRNDADKDTPHSCRHHLYCLSVCSYRGVSL